jgi:hypothetical protein
VADEMEKPLGAIREYLLLQVAEGRLRRSEILLSIEPLKRQQYEEYISQSGSDDYWHLTNNCHKSRIARDEFRLYLECRWCKRGDIYEYISNIEVRLHNQIRSALEREFGNTEAGWWRRGVPPEIRTSCVEARERDPEPAPEAFCYTTFIHLSTIIERMWNLLVPILPREFRADRPELLRNLRRLNQIRNAVMHPAKGLEPSDEDLRFVQFLHSRLCPSGS